MAPMGIRLSPLGIAVFCLLGVGVIYHLYAGVLSSRIALFRQKRTVDLRDLLALSMEAAVQGGREVKRIREDNTLEEKSKGKTKEGASEKLTLGDLNSHRKMFYLIKNTYPYIQVNSEEHADAEGEATVWTRIIPEEILGKISGVKEVPAERITVWIDPLDATQEYTENLQKYVTTMVCVAVDGDPVIGVIHKPFTGYTAWGFVGEGSNVAPRASYNTNFPKVIVSRSHSGKVKSFVQVAFGNNTEVLPAGGAENLTDDTRSAELYTQKDGQSNRIITMRESPGTVDCSSCTASSLMYMLKSVGLGLQPCHTVLDEEICYKVLALLDPTDEEQETADIYIHVTYIKKWDICAGDAILRSLGGEMTTLKGEQINYSGTEGNKGGLLASIKTDHKALVKRLSPWEENRQ
ncbi:inositol monophosphatase 3 isoform X2 [Puntigrus tetrazona]|uniref:inositol monophosphatase 3 isoform X2 n=1 Tax=Puntigrus tetrazona TaxID=1606681 RepID=UPI001C8968B3|nr:inositol monophosphatase 3 isoform X2 [Puntigrus tetrazona]